MAWPFRGKDALDMFSDGESSGFSGTSIAGIVPEARGPKFAGFLKQVGVEEFIQPLSIGGVMKARFVDWEVREVSLDGQVARLPEDGTVELWETVEAAVVHRQTGVTSAPGDYQTREDGRVDYTEDYRQAYEEGYQLGGRAAEFIRETCGEGAAEQIEKFNNSVRKLGTSGEKDYRRRLFTWAFEAGPGGIAVAYKIRGALAGMMKGSLAVVPLKLLSDKVIFYGAVETKRNDFLLSCMDEFEAARVLYFFGAGYSSDTMLVLLKKSSGKGRPVVSKLTRQCGVHFPDMRIAVYQEETESSGAVVELSWSRKYSPVGLYGGGRWRFVIGKSGWDTTAMQRTIERRLDLPKDSMHVAGLKDKFGVTYQFATLPATHTEGEIQRAIEGINSLVKTGDVALRVGEFKKTENGQNSAQLRHGMLSGNCFRLRIRDVRGERAVGKVRQSSMGEVGFINYFGLQRFGINPHHDHSRHTNVDIGAALVSGDYERAVRLILTPATSDTRDVADVLRDWHESGQASVAAERLGKIRSRERDFEMWSRMLNQIAAQPNSEGFRRSLRAGVPRELLQIHLLAFQSCLWNRMASKRFREGGLKVLPGDVVLDRQTGVLSIAGSSTERYSVEDVFIPAWGSQLGDKDKLLKIGINTRSLYRELLEDSVSRGEASPRLLEETLDLDFSRSLGVRARLPCIPRRFLAKPEGFRCSEEIEGDQRNLILEFFLPRGSYATMLLREVMEEGSLPGS
ncbi:hypothetical protein FOL47_007109 [Perkinsus chesapeaki]|uniref:TRUD domain-containing protein n=1 Tax=Perkinsus chesapeaki TaxID=330153 RepID=A0A7J6MW81_PERCH|nr:hypothetical protein FOL47_007109 [Perkinsus chesapeaki]